MDDLDRFLSEQLKDPEFKEEWEKNHLEFEIEELLIKYRQSKNFAGDAVANLLQMYMNLDERGKNTLLEIAKVLTVQNVRYSKISAS